ncbi:hypothetical protein RhiirA5_170990 [Rhizophagus irregularis]|uniref:Uncharacterized protein n=1 Tax=Rhizophagus irregularis TaxID=588596 RepID=A0A2I1ELD1_9GLOM|nr:hypothetical protein RhiirA5_170990 [Rhizophagus irregularis]PKC72844.1 hypothetical protein RhiirA1_16214 [Rhizophagus irregularis]PKY22930.1 hypothetical protein RhiirB3_201910 [Rhizophagus irregularis]
MRVVIEKFFWDYYFIRFLFRNCITFKKKKIQYTFNSLKKASLKFSVFKKKNLFLYIFDSNFFVPWAFEHMSIKVSNTLLLRLKLQNKF